MDQWLKYQRRGLPLMGLYQPCLALDEVIAERFPLGTATYTPREPFPHKWATRRILRDLRDFGVTFLGRAHFKMIFDVPGGHVLKVGAQQTLAHEMKVYWRTPAAVRRVLFVPILWITKFFMLQEKVEYGELVPQNAVKELVRLAKAAGVTDLRHRNFGKCRDGRFRLFDFFAVDVWKEGVRDLDGRRITQRALAIIHRRNPLDLRLTEQVPRASRPSDTKRWIR
jgi:hypothetical protein